MVSTTAADVLERENEEAHAMIQQLEVGTLID